MTLQFVTVAGAVFYQNQNKNQYILQSVQRSKGQSMSKKESVNQCVCVCVTFMLGGAVRGGDGGHSPRGTLVMFSCSCFLQSRECDKN